MANLTANDSGVGIEKAFAVVQVETAPQALYVPLSPSMQQTPPSSLYAPLPNLRPSLLEPIDTGFNIPVDWMTATITIYRPSNVDDEAGARSIGNISTWTVLFKNVVCAMILESVTEANPEDETHQVLEQVARYGFFTNMPITQGVNAVQDSDIIAFGPFYLPPTRFFVVKSWEQWPEINPTIFKLHGQEIRP